MIFLSPDFSLSLSVAAVFSLMQSFSFCQGATADNEKLDKKGDRYIITITTGKPAEKT